MRNKWSWTSFTSASSGCLFLDTFAGSSCHKFCMNVWRWFKFEIRRGMPHHHHWNSMLCEPPAVENWHEDPWTVGISVCSNSNYTPSWHACIVTLLRIFLMLLTWLNKLLTDSKWTIAFCVLDFFAEDSLNFATVSDFRRCLISLPSCYSKLRYPCPSVLLHLRLSIIIVNM